MHGMSQLKRLCAKPRSTWGSSSDYRIVAGPHAIEELLDQRRLADARCPECRRPLRGLPTAASDARRWASCRTRPTKTALARARLAPANLWDWSGGADGLDACAYVDYYLNERKSVANVGSAAHNASVELITDLIYNAGISCDYPAPN
jgi:hypothetical protein